jgi:hypothetical protein
MTATPTRRIGGAGMHNHVLATVLNQLKPEERNVRRDLVRAAENVDVTAPDNTRRRRKSAHATVTSASSK